MLHLLKGVLVGGSRCMRLDGDHQNLLDMTADIDIAASCEKFTVLMCLPNHRETHGIAVNISRNRCYLSKKNDSSTHFANGGGSLRAGKCGFSPLHHLSSNPSG